MRNDKPEARIFPVDTDFQKMARRPGGVSRDEAIERAEAAIEEVRPEFNDWLDRKLKEITSLIAAASSGNAEPDWIAAANNCSRELRDIGTTMQFELLSFVANSLCELLDLVEACSESSVMESIVCHADALMLARQEAYRHLLPEEVSDLTGGLRHVVRRASP